MSYYFSSPTTLTIYNSHYESSFNTLSLSKKMYTSEFEYSLESKALFCFGKKINKISLPKLAIGFLSDKNQINTIAL